MSFYDYKCTQCESIQEEVHSIKLEPKISCIKCSGICKRQMPTQARFILKGNNWADKKGKPNGK